MSSRNRSAGQNVRLLRQPFAQVFPDGARSPAQDWPAAIAEEVLFHPTEIDGFFRFQSSLLSSGNAGQVF